jgi:hypothetical protein
MAQTFNEMGISKTGTKEKSLVNMVVVKNIRCAVREI